ncbi:MAG: NAD(P)/FAD-dependent oxidoreductase [Pseudomonadota bacterium]
MYDVVVIGGGAAGIGVGVALQSAGISNFTILERFFVGASFELWPEETQFITPSFPTNSIGMLDLNSVAIGTSPAFLLDSEHPTGIKYAAYLQTVTDYFELPLQEETKVLHIKKNGGKFEIDIDNKVITAKHVIWAAGEFQNPKLNGFAGSEHCKHTATIDSYKNLKGDDFIIIGGGESGFDAAYHLAYQGKRVTLLDQGCPWQVGSSDPSLGLSTYSLERMRENQFKQQVSLIHETSIASVTRLDEVYEVRTTNGDNIHTLVAPILASGFERGHKLIADFFENREDGYPLLNEQDESTLTPGLYLCGPGVRHDNHIFCFIYKYRQRFAVVAKSIATSLDLPAEELEEYRNWGMYLDDLSCCGQECLC